MASSRKSALVPEDLTLFRESMCDVTPLRQRQRVQHARRLPRPVAAQRLLDDREALRASLSDALPWEAGFETGEELCYTREGVGAPTLRKLRRGHWVIQGELDLHGLTVAQARASLAEFLSLCARRGWRCVRVVHGKGLRSRHREPVLKRKVGQWLMQRDEVLAFCQARPADGGGGAAMVLLRTR